MDAPDIIAPFESVITPLRVEVVSWAVRKAKEKRKEREISVRCSSSFMRVKFLQRERKNVNLMLRQGYEDINSLADADSLKILYKSILKSFHPAG